MMKKSISTKTHIVNHWMCTHPEMNSPTDMAFNITALFRDCLSRQVAEALRIGNYRDILLNSNWEYIGRRRKLGEGNLGKEEKSKRGQDW